MRLARALHVKEGLRIFCLKFSKNGKYLTVGFAKNGVMTIYDVQTGQKSWLVLLFF